MSSPATGGDHLKHAGHSKVGFVEVVEESNGESRTTTSMSGSDSPLLSPAKQKTPEETGDVANDEDAGDKRQRRRSLNLGKFTGFLISKKSTPSTSDDSVSAAGRSATTAELPSTSTPEKQRTFGAVVVGSGNAPAPPKPDVTSPPLPMFFVGQSTPRSRPQGSMAIADKPGYWIENFDDSPPVPEGDSQVALFRIEDFNYHYHYGKYFFGNEHYNFTGVSDQVGPILVSIMKHPTYPAGYQAPADAPRSRPKSLSMANVKKFMSLRGKAAREEDAPPMSPKPALERQTSVKKVTDTPLSPTQSHVDRSAAHPAQSPPASPSISNASPSSSSVLSPSQSSPSNHNPLASSNNGESNQSSATDGGVNSEGGSSDWLADALGKESATPVASLHDGFFRALVRYKTGDIALKIPVKSNKKHSAKELIEALKEMVSMMTEIPFDLAAVQFKESHIPHQAILDMEHRLMPKGYKFGVMYAKQGQTTDDEILSNEEGSAAFETFLKQLGDRVELTGFTGYNGGLDVRHGSTGTHSVHTQFKDYEIMFHVSTLLPHVEGDQQQLEKKRHIGNDVVVIVFQDADTPFEPDLIKSFFNHVFVVVRPIKPGAGGNAKLGTAGPSPFGNLARRPGDSRAMPLVRKRSTSDLGKSEISQESTASSGGGATLASSNSATASTETSESTDQHHTDAEEPVTPRSNDAGNNTSADRSKRLRRTMSQGIDKSVVRRVGILGPSPRGKPEMIRAESKDGLPRLATSATSTPSKKEKEISTTSPSSSGTAKVATPASVAKSDMKKSSSKDHIPEEKVQEEREKKEKKEREKREKEREKEEKEKREKEEKERKEREKKEKKEQKEREKEKEKEKERERKAEKEREKEKKKDKEDKDKSKEKEHKDKEKGKDKDKDTDNKDHSTSSTKATDDEKRHSDSHKDTIDSEKKEKLKNQHKLSNSRMRSVSQAEVPRSSSAEKRHSAEDAPAPAHTHAAPTSDNELAGSEDSNAPKEPSSAVAAATPQRKKSVHRKPSGKMTVTSASSPSSPAEDREASSGDSVKKHRSHRKSGRHTVLPVADVVNNSSGAGTSSGSDTDAYASAGILSASTPRLPPIADDSDFEGNDHQPVVVGSSPRSFEDGAPLETLAEEEPQETAEAAAAAPEAAPEAQPAPSQQEERKSPKKPGVVPVLPVTDIPPPLVVEPTLEPAAQPAPSSTEASGASAHSAPEASAGLQNVASQPVSPRQLLAVPHTDAATGSFSAAPQRKRSKKNMETYIPAAQSIASPRDIDVSAALTWLNPEPEPLEPIPPRLNSPAVPSSTGDVEAKPADATSDAVSSEAAAPATADAASQTAGDANATAGEGGSRRGNGQAMRSLFRKKSQFMVKQETTIRSFLRYRVEIVCKDGVVQAEQTLPNPPIFHHGTYFKEFLLTKLINSERASYFAPQFARPLERTRQILLENLFHEHNK